MRCRVCFAHDSTCIRPQWTRQLLTDYAAIIERRDRKALNGNCCLQQVFTYVSLPADAGCHQGVAVIGHHRREYVLGDLEGEGSAVARIQGYMDRAVPFDDVELRVLGEDGHPIYVASSGRPIYDAAGGIVGYRGVTRDITARLYAEEQLRQAQQDAQRRQAQKMEAIGVL